MKITPREEMADIYFIIVDWLKNHGYDGLVNGDYGCGCEIGDLAPCDSINLGECAPAYKWPCEPETCDNPDCDSSPPAFCMRREKPPEVRQEVERL